jgi:hypothetical protein
MIMNKTPVLLATLLALSLPFTGCNKSGKLAEHSTFKTPSGPVELKMKWPVGERIEQDMDMKTTMEITLPGQPAPMKQDMTMGQAYGLTVLSATPDGGHEVEMDFLSARMGMKSGDKTMIDYDSSKKASPDKPDPAADVFSKIVGSKIQYFLDASNAVDHIEGVDDLMNKLASGGDAAASAAIKSMFSEGYFKQMMSANLFLPPNAVQPGDIWPVRFELPLSAYGTMVLEYTFTLQGWEMHGPRNCARLEFTGTIVTKPDPAAKPGALTISILDGTTTGVSWFDPELGIIIDTTMNQDMKMVMNMPLPGKPGAAPRMQNITSQMSQAMTIKLASVK